MDKVIEVPAGVPEKPILEFVDTVGIFKFLYFEWLRFFRANMTCGWECPKSCPLDEDCPEIQNVWDRWLKTLPETLRLMVE
jgi:hypothetical protein